MPLVGCYAITQGRATPAPVTAAAVAAPTINLQRCSWIINELLPKEG